MRIIVDVFLDIEGLVIQFEIDRDVHIHARITGFVLIILDISVAEFAYRRQEFTRFVHEGQHTDAVGAGDLHVIRSEGRGGVYDAGTIFGREQNHPSIPGMRRAAVSGSMGLPKGMSCS